jgi:DNA-binding CsgD family transcriptional regulator
MAELTLNHSHAVGVLEAVANHVSGVGAWVDAVTGAVDALLPSPLGNGALLNEVCDSGGRIVHVTRGPSMSDELLTYADEHMHRPDIFEPFYLDSQHVCTAADVRPSLTAEGNQSLERSLKMLNAQDLIGLAARSESSHALAIIGIRQRHEPLSTRVRLALGRVALHIEVGLRLRLDPASLVAVLRPDGRLVHAEPEAQPRALREQLGAHAAQIDRARLQRNRGDPATLDGWSALVAGRYGFLERDGAQREYLVYANSPRTASTRAWSAAEARAVELSATGMPGKLVAYALGVSDGEVSRLLGSAAAKVGFANRTELVRLAAVLRMRPAKQHQALASLGLSETERAVLELLQRGLANDEIAALRGTSPRTVANQVASVLRKTRLPSRRALATLSA